MKCGICKADMEEKKVSYTEDIDQSTIVIRHVPAQVCTECGNTWYSIAVAAELEKMVDSFAAAVSLAEISVINYTKSVA